MQRGSGAVDLELTEQLGPPSSPGSLPASCRRWNNRRRKRTGCGYRGLAEDEDQTDKQDEDKTLLNYFRQMNAASRDTDQVDLHLLDQMISDGADPNSSDRFGQTVVHEVSRAWSVDVMRFFLSRGSDLLRADQFGVTALHVAAALDYHEMVHFLLEHNADPSAQTLLDRQTALHFAVKNDSVCSARLLLAAGAEISCLDYKLRTPLQLAANMERSEAARLLLEFGADAGIKDSDGQLCITALIGHMSPVARLALQQFYVSDKMTRNRFYYLNLLEPDPGAAISEPTTPLEVVVHLSKLDLIMEPVFLKLIQVKWKLYGRLGAWLLLIFNFLFNVSWTTVAISVSVQRDSPHRYVLPEDWWRVALVMVALLLTVMEVVMEIGDITRSNRKFSLWRRWAEQRIHDDMDCLHPMWPQEKHFLSDQEKQIQKMKGSYSHDMWNVFDWLVYCLLIGSFGVHVADVISPSASLHLYSLRLFSLSIIFLWIRLMKHVRAFRLMGPFIVMLGSISGDVMCFLFLYAEIFIPYACSFWIMFGGLPTVPSMQSVSGLLFSLYRITLVDEYEYAAMARVDDVMAPLLCGTFLAFSSILCVNLLVALLTDTFQRVHDNSLANAVMQQASVILRVEDSMPFLRRFYDDRYIATHCAPLADAYNDDITTNSRNHDEMTRITTEIKETLDNFLQLQKDVETVSGAQTDRADEVTCLRAELKELRVLMKQLIQNQTDPGTATRREDLGPS